MNHGGGESEDERPVSTSTIRGPRDPRNSTRRSATTPLPGDSAPTSYHRSDQPPSSYPQRPSSQNARRLPQAPQRSNTAPVAQQHPQSSGYDTDDSDDIYVNDDEYRQSSSAEGPSFPNPQHHPHPHQENRLHIPMPMPMPTPSPSAPAFPTPQGSGNIAMPRPVSFATDSEQNEYHDANSQFDDNSNVGSNTSGHSNKHSFPAPLWETQDRKLESDYRRSPPPPSSFPEPRIGTGRRNDSLGQPSSPGRPSGPRNSLDQQPQQSGPKPIVIRPMPTPPPLFPTPGTSSASPRRTSFGAASNPNRHVKLSNNDDLEVEEPEQMPEPAPSMPTPGPSMPIPGHRYGPVRPAGRVHTMPKPGEPPRRSSTDRARRPSIEAGNQNQLMPMPGSSSGGSGPMHIHLPPPPSMPAPTPHSSGITRPPSSTGHGRPYVAPSTLANSGPSDPKPITNVLPPTSHTVQNHNQYVDALNASHPRPPSANSHSHSHTQHQQQPHTRPSGSSSTGHGHNLPPPARPGTVHTISSTAPSQATNSPAPSRPPTTFTGSTTSTVTPYPNKPPASTTSHSTAAKPPTRPTTEHTAPTSHNAPQSVKPSISSSYSKPLPSTSKPPPALAPGGHHAPSSAITNNQNSNSNNTNTHHPTPPTSHNDSPQMPTRPHLFTGTSQMDTQYVNMLLALDDIPYWYNLLASFFTWILLAGFILFPGTFTSLQSASATNALPVNSPIVVEAVKGITKLPLFIVAWVCTGIGIAGMIWLTVRWRKNYLWALNKIFVPGLLNSLAGLLSTLASIFGAQNGELVDTSRITLIVLAASTGTFLILVAVYSLWFIRRIKAKHDKQVGKERAGKHGEGVVDLSKRKNR